MIDNNKGEPMSIKDRLTGGPVQAHQFCTVGKLLEQLSASATVLDDADDLRALVAALSDARTWPATDLSRVLSEEGHTVSTRHIREHRKRDHTIRDCAYPEVGTDQHGGR